MAEFLKLDDANDLDDLIRQLKRVRDRQQDRLRLTGGGEKLRDVSLLVNEILDGARGAPFDEGRMEGVLEYIISNVPHTVFWKDVNGAFLGGNENLIRDLGARSLTDVIGKTDYDYFPREQADFFRSCDLAVMESGVPQPDIEEPQAQADGTHTLLTSKVPLRDGSGAVIGLLGIYVDITERKRMEEELRCARDAAQEKNQELQSMNAELRATQEQLVHAARITAVGTLVAGISHELNNPLNAILLNAQSLQARISPGDAATQKALSIVVRNAKRCGQLVGTLLDFSRKKPPTRERLPIQSIFHRLVELSLGEARRGDVELDVNLPADRLPDLLACPHEIETALLNLVGNALDATTAGGAVSISARALTDDKLGPGVELSVADSGHGIPEHALPHIFDPFFTTKPVGQGTGLGLSITHKIVDDHGGRIHVDSTPAGTTVRIWLPAVADAPSPGLKGASA